MKKEIGICEGCLSAERYLQPLGDLTEIYCRIVGVHSTHAKPLLCWECRKILRNGQKFQQRVKLAQSYLSLSSPSGNQQDVPISLSNLSITKNDTYDDSIVYDSPQLIVPDIHSHEVKFDNEIMVKQEDPNATYDDIAMDYEDGRTSIKKESLGGYDEEKYKPELELGLATDMCQIVMTPEIEITQRRKPNEGRYKTILMDKSILQFRKKSYYKTDLMTDEEVKEWRQNERVKSKYYRTMPHKCESCLCGFPSEELHAKHVKIWHSKSVGKYTCHWCDKRLGTKTRMEAHCRDHYRRYTCLLCKRQYHHRNTLYYHFELMHGKLYQCNDCEIIFDNLPAYNTHFKRLHKYNICDYCGRRFTAKARLEKHVKKHMPAVCKLCKTTFRRQDSLQKHLKEKHERMICDSSYCVECDMQFNNITLYKRHLMISVKHRRKPVVPCPECGKCYVKRCSMMNHYRLVHTQQTKHYCQQCDRYFLNGFRLRQHMSSFHYKVAPVKNKMCAYCGRGFSTNRILENHVRTHTGERPFACELCYAAFTQKQALTAHVRAIHHKKQPAQR